MLPSPTSTWLAFVLPSCNQSWTSLMLASKNGHDSVVETLLREGGGEEGGDEGVGVEALAL